MIAFDPTFDESQLDPDTERMIRVAAGDRIAFDELVARHFPSTVRIIAAMMGSRSQAEDLAQDVFLRVFRSRQRYVPTAKFSTWLGTITRNVVLNAKRSLSRSRVSFAPLGDEPTRGEGDFVSTPIPSVESDPIAEVDEREIVAAVTAAVSQLPPRQRRAIELVYFRGMSYSKAAQEMETSWKAVKSLLGRGRGELGTTLHEEYERHFATGH